jgi:hypothetical protein
MSKILSDLKESEPNHFQEELAKTYFSSAPAPSKGTSLIGSHTANSEYKKRRTIFFGAIAAASLIVLAAGFLVFNRVVVNINIIPALGSDSMTGRNPSDIIYLNKDGELNTDLIKNIVFYENSNSENIWGKKFIILSNAIASKKAVLGIDFTEPLNLKDNLFCFYAKGRAGDEELRISLRDINGYSCNSKVNELEKPWQQFVVNVDDAADFIDPEKITHIDFEVNPLERQNPAVSKTYIKDLYLAKRRE